MGAIAIRARGAGYFHVDGLGDALVGANGWDAAELTRYRSNPTFARISGKQADKALSRQQLIDVSRALPDEWIASSSVAGDAKTCAALLRGYLAAGADEIILHGSTAEHFASLVAAFTSGR